MLFQVWGPRHNLNFTHLQSSVVRWQSSSTGQCTWRIGVYLCWWSPPWDYTGRHDRWSIWSWSSRRVFDYTRQCPLLAVNSTLSSLSTATRCPTQPRVDFSSTTSIEILQSFPRFEIPLPIQLSNWKLFSPTAGEIHSGAFWAGCPR